MATATKTATKKKATVVASKDLKAKKETSADILDRSLKWAEELTKKAGIPAGAYAKGPNGMGTFIMGRSPGVPGNIQIWAGHKDVNFTVYPDKKKRQAVINVRESKRTVEASFIADLTQSWGSFAKIDDSEKAVRAALSGPGTLRNHFSVSLPPTAPDNPITYKLKSVTQLKPTYGRYSGYGLENQRVHKYRVVIEATVPSTNVSFLVGYDEKSLFIAMLPKHVKTVDNAHKALRPAGVPADALRHGEWFFVPTTKSDEVIIDRFLEGPLVRHSIYKNDSLEWNSSWSGSSHRASEVIWPNDGRNTSAVNTQTLRYARGTIKDGRAGHHSPLTLGDGNTWYRVVRNAEVVPETVNNPAGGSSRRWD